MPLSKRILIALIVVLIDLVIFFIPVSALFLAYILIANPAWFRKLLSQRTA